MYDLGSSRAVRRGFGGADAGGGIEERRAGVVRKRRWRRPVAGGACLCTMYDLRCTIWGIRALARGAGAFSVLVKFLENAVYFV